MRTLQHYSIVAGRSKGETGVWIEPEIKGRERKICAMGVRCSRWVTMHGLALNIETDLSYFNNIIPCGIPDKQVTSIEQETGKKVSREEVKALMIQEFATVFDAAMVLANTIPLEK
jgi:lipoyl(octanoyl) transferase